jgi:Protein of unknown function (DUF3223)
VGKGIPIILEAHTFSSSGEVVKHFKRMLNKYRPGDAVSEEDGRDLAALLKGHTQYNEKIDSGVDHTALA